MRGVAGIIRSRRGLGWKACAIAMLLVVVAFLANDVSHRSAEPLPSPSGPGTAALYVRTAHMNRAKCEQAGGLWDRGHQFCLPIP